MTRTSTIVTLAVLSLILTPVVVKATGTSPETSAAVQQTKVETAAVLAQASAGAPACARQVKVVYAGYGEAHGAACAVSGGIRR